MAETSLLALPEGIVVDQIHLTDTGFLIELVATAPTACCPVCSEPSSSVHCHYRRTLRDAPCAGRRVQFVLTVRTFSCRNGYCERKVFAERFPDFVEPRARATIRFSEQITCIGLSTCGNGGTRLATRLGIQTSRQTILRRILALPENSTGSVLYVGIDDFSFRRGYRFGTLLVDLESRRVVDLLPDREAETAAQWMRERPEIFAVSRDRGGQYAKAAALGAPQATQCADRFHLTKNLTEATQLFLARCQAEILAASEQELSAQRQPNTPLIPLEQWRPPEPPSGEKARLARRANRHARYQQAVQLGQQGMTPKEIAGRLGLSDRTIQKWLAAGTFPEVRKRRKKASPFDAFAAYVLRRWNEGEHKGVTLYREIKARGYTSSDRSLYRYLATLKRVEIQAPITLERIKKETPNTAVWLFVRDPPSLDTVEQEDLATLLQASPALKSAYDLVQSFFTMVRKREGTRLEAWLARVAKSG